MPTISRQLAKLNLSMTPAAQQKAMDFLQLLAKWNRAYNLTAIDTLDQMISHHLLDSLAVAPYLTGKHILDVGTGAGFPGIPLALYYPDKQFTLLDSNGKKTRFLTQAIAELKITNVAITQARVEDFKVNNHTTNCFDAIIFRAVKSIPEMVSKTKHLCCDNGHFLAMKAGYPTKELQNLNNPFTVQALNVPGLNAERHLIIIEHNRGSHG